MVLVGVDVDNGCLVVGKGRGEGGKGGGGRVGGAAHARVGVRVVEPPM